MVCTPLVTGANTVVGYVCGPGKTYRRSYRHCNACGRSRRWVTRFDGLYYGETDMCCGCGAMWQDGCRSRDYPDAQETARRWWAEAMSPREYRAHVDAIFRSHFADD